MSAAPISSPVVASGDSRTRPLPAGTEQPTKVYTVVEEQGTLQKVVTLPSPQIPSQTSAPSEPASDELDTWSCDKCSTINHQSMIVCPKCEQMRVDPENTSTNPQLQTLREINMSRKMHDYQTHLVTQFRTRDPQMQYTQLAIKTSQKRTWEQMAQMTNVNAETLQERTEILQRKRPKKRRMPITEKDEAARSTAIEKPVEPGGYGAFAQFRRMAKEKNKRASKHLKSMLEEARENGTISEQEYQTFLKDDYFLEYPLLVRHNISAVYRANLLEQGIGEGGLLSVQEFQAVAKSPNREEQPGSQLRRKYDQGFKLIQKWEPASFEKILGSIQQFSVEASERLDIAPASTPRQNLQNLLKDFEITDWNQKITVDTATGTAHLQFEVVAQLREFMESEDKIKLRFLDQSNVDKVRARLNLTTTTPSTSAATASELRVPRAPTVPSQRLASLALHQTLQQPSGRYVPKYVLARRWQRVDSPLPGDQHNFYSRTIQTRGKGAQPWTNDMQRMYQLIKDQDHFFAPYYTWESATLPYFYMAMWQNGWTWDARHQKWIRYQRNNETQCEYFHAWQPLPGVEMQKWADKGWHFNYLKMRWDYQHEDRHVDLTPYPDVEVKHYPEFSLPQDNNVLNQVYRDHFYYADVPPHGYYKSSDTAADDLANCPSTGIVP